jgi:hypothetical protein
LNETKFSIVANHNPDLVLVSMCDGETFTMPIVAFNCEVDQYGNGAMPLTIDYFSNKEMNNQFIWDKKSDCVWGKGYTFPTLATWESWSNKSQAA